MGSAVETAKQIIRQHRGIIRTSEALKDGIHPRTLYFLRDQGVLEQLSRGVYRMVEFSPVADPDLLVIAVRAPQSVVCLISALYYHGITTQVPHKVSIAVEKGGRTPKIDHPPIVVHHFSKAPFVAGVEKHEIDGVQIGIYSKEKTLADCFKFRNMLGMDVVLESLKLYRAQEAFKADELLKYADICRVKSVMQPYLEAIV